MNHESLATTNLLSKSPTKNSQSVAPGWLRSRCISRRPFGTYQPNLHIRRAPEQGLEP